MTVEDDPADASERWLPSTAAVIGLGLMGGSLARDLAQHRVSVMAYDSRPDVAEAARGEGIVARLLRPDLGGIEGAEMVIVATPVDAAPGLLDRVGPLIGPETIVTDLGSTKESICRHAERIGIGSRFVGSHPLAGDHRSGWSASRPGLFSGAPVFLCPTVSSTDEAIRAVRSFWTALGGSCSVMNPGEHDRRMAWASHLPQVLSSALALALSRAGIPPSVLGPGGRDMVRLAGSDPEIWTAICRDNAGQLTGAADGMIRQLSLIRDDIDELDTERIRDFFVSARRWQQGGGGEGEKS